MFTKKKIIVACFLALFGIHEAMAASISTRVRVVEGKVAKQEKSMKTLEDSYKAQAGEVKAELSKIKALESKVDALLKAQEKTQKGEKTLADKRYAFP